jgi:hypothetical protein
MYAGVLRVFALRRRTCKDDLYRAGDLHRLLPAADPTLLAAGKAEASTPSIVAKIRHL